MNTVQIESLSVDDLKDIITDIIRTEVPKNKEETIYLNVKQVSKLLGVSTVTVHTWKESGVLRAYRIGTRIRFKRSGRSISAIGLPSGSREFRSGPPSPASVPARKSRSGRIFTLSLMPTY